MKQHRVTVYVIDHDGRGADGVVEEMGRVRYPNDCIHPKFVKAETWDVGEWDDDHPLNLNATHAQALKALFATEPESTIGGDE